MKRSETREQIEAVGVIAGAGFAGGVFALGIAWLFHAITVEYVRLAAQVLTFPKF